MWILTYFAISFSHRSPFWVEPSISSKSAFRFRGNSSGTPDNCDPKASNSAAGAARLGSSRCSVLVEGYPIGVMRATRTAKKVRSIIHRPTLHYSTVLPAGCTTFQPIIPNSLIKPRINNHHSANESTVPQTPALALNNRGRKAFVGWGFYRDCIGNGDFYC